MREEINRQTGLNETLLGRILAIRHIERLNGVVRPVRLASSISYTITPKGKNIK